MSWLSVNNLSKSYEGVSVLTELSFSLARGTQLGIAGATGSSKTTLLRIIAGLVQADSGAVFLNQSRVLGPDEKLLPGHAEIGYLSQHFELRNNYRVIEELEMASTLTKVEEGKIFSHCQIDHLLNRKTTALSGGERQRVALARVLLKAPQLLLLDEPFSNLDPGHKRTIKQVLKKITQEMDLTTILVSHDGADLLSWADYLFLLQNGQIVQEGTPQELYSKPIDEYTAGLLGEYTRIDSTDPLSLIELFKNNNSLNSFPFYVRPEQVQFSSASSNSIEVVIEKCHFMGGYFLVEVKVGDKVLLVQSDRCEYLPGSHAFVCFR